MSILGSILSITPSIAGVVGELFDGHPNDYVRYAMPTLDGELADVYFEKSADDRIIIHNGCRFPIHVSMDAINAVENDILILGFSEEDITDLLVSHTLNNVDKLRITTNGNSSSGSNVMAITCSGKVTKGSNWPVLIGKNVCIQLVENDLLLIVSLKCKLEEISLLSITGEGNEPSRVYENVTPEAHIPVVNDKTGESNVIRFPGAITPFCYSQDLHVTASLQCSLMQNEVKSDERNKLLAGKEWDFLRKGRCLNK